MILPTCGSAIILKARALRGSLGEVASCFFSLDWGWTPSMGGRSRGEGR